LGNGFGRVDRWGKNWLWGRGQHWGWVLVVEPEKVASGALGVGRVQLGLVTRAGLVND